MQQPIKIVLTLNERLPQIQTGTAESLQRVTGSDKCHRYRGNATHENMHNTSRNKPRNVEIINNIQHCFISEFWHQQQVRSITTNISTTHLTTTANPTHWLRHVVMSSDLGSWVIFFSSFSGYFSGWSVVNVLSFNDNCESITLGAAMVGRDLEVPPSFSLPSFRSSSCVWVRCQSRTQACIYNNRHDL